MSVRRRSPPPKRFTRIFGSDYRRIALNKRREELKIKQLLKIALRRNDEAMKQRILDEGAKRIRFYEREYEALQRLIKKRYYNGGEPNELLPRRRPRLHKFDSKIVIAPHKSIFPGRNYPKITNFVVTVHFGRAGKDLYVDQHRIPLYLPNAVKNSSFAAVIIPQDGATALFFSNCKTVLTGTTTPESALFALQMYRLSLSRVRQPVIVCDDSCDPPLETYEVCYLKTILDFHGFKGTNTVGSGPITKDGYTVDLSALAERYPETNWKPEIFPGLKFHLPEGNEVIPGGKKCTAHLFEGRIVLMGLEIPEHIAIAYYFFLELVRPFLDKSSPDYEEDKYSYRYKRMLWKLNEPTEQQRREEEEERLRLQQTFNTGAYSKPNNNNNKERARCQGKDVVMTITDDASSSSVTLHGSMKLNESENGNANGGGGGGGSLFDFDLKDQLPAAMLKKMATIMKASAQINTNNKNIHT